MIKMMQKLYAHVTEMADTLKEKILNRSVREKSNTAYFQSSLVPVQYSVVESEPLGYNPLVCGQRCLAVKPSFTFLKPKSLGSMCWPDPMKRAQSCLPRYIVYVNLNGTVLYKTNIIWDWRRPKTSIWDHELMTKWFTDVINLETCEQWNWLQ